MAAKRSDHPTSPGPRKPSSSSRSRSSSRLRPAPHRFSLHDTAPGPGDAGEVLSEVEAVALLTGQVRPSLVEVEAVCQRLEAGVLARSVVRAVERVWAARAVAPVPVLGGTQLELFAPKARRRTGRKAG